MVGYSETRDFPRLALVDFGLPEVSCGLGQRYATMAAVDISTCNSCHYWYFCFYSAKHETAVMTILIS